jgi:L-alanine-DL-glutamate epimerase-like enolase superfamily enzyme
MQLKFYRAELPFHFPFTISGGRTKHVQEALLVSLSQEGFTGFGEAPAIKYYQIDIDELAAKGLIHKKEIEAFSSQNPYAFNELLDQLFPHDSFLRCALDLAFWDLLSKMNDSSPAALAGLTLTEKVPCDYTIGIDTPEAMLKKMEALPWPVYKIKVGFDGDAELLNTLCKHSNAMFRLDANAAWELKAALRFLDQVQQDRIQFIEQPLKLEHVHQMDIDICIHIHMCIRHHMIVYFKRRCICIVIFIFGIFSIICILCVIVCIFILIIVCLFI